jgi:DNA modification methylase
MSWTLLQGDCIQQLRTIQDGSIHCCVTSPPYWGLRDYGVDGQLGTEPTPEEYVAKMVEVFREVKRVLRKDGTLWLNIGDSYGGARGNISPAPDNKHNHDEADTPGAAKRGTLRKQLLGIPWRLAFALQADGWYLRSDIIWAKGNPMPESVTDRPTKAHEYIFLFAKSERYFYDVDAIREPHTHKDAVRNTGDWAKSVKEPGYADALPEAKKANRNGRNKRTVWNINTKPFPEAHFAVFPPEIPEICIKAGCPEGGTVLDPFAGAGTTLWVAEQLDRNSIGIELNPEYCEIIRRRMATVEPSLFNISRGPY